MTQPRLKLIIRAVILSAIVMLPVIFGFLYRPDSSFCDLLYQIPESTDKDIRVIGIDEHALKELGPLPWKRSVMASVIQKLCADADNKPSVIGIDVIYAGNTDPESDTALAKAALDAENIVTASAATFGSEVNTDGPAGSINQTALQGLDGPFDELSKVSATGQINVMSDMDGIIRHSLLYIDTPSGRLDSFALKIADIYKMKHNLKTDRLPQVNARKMWYLPFTAKPGGYYESVSVADILHGKVDPSYWSGKIILIGPYASGTQDEYPTAIDHARKMYGIEIQANTINALLDNNYKTEVPELPQVLLLLVFTFLTALFMADRKAVPSLIYYLVSASSSIFICRELYKHGLVLHALWIPVSASVIYIASVIMNYVRTARDRIRITNTFGHYVDPSVLKELLKEGSDTLKPGGKSMNIAVLFVDIRGFTSMSESIDPADVVQILNRYLSLTTDCIMRNHGTLDKFVGDCTMGIWNAPVPQDDYVMYACRAAIDMINGSKALADELRVKYGKSISFGIGIHTGPAVVGNIGSSMRMDYTAIGDTVNTASRLESNAPGGTIYISHAVANVLKSRIITAPVDGPVSLKGKSENIEVLKLINIEK